MPSGECTACRPGFFVSSISGKCVLLQDPMYLNLTDNKIYPCSIKCARCVESPTNCIRCDSNLALMPGSTVCEAVPDGFFALSLWQYPCRPNCEICNTFESCQVCKPGFAVGLSDCIPVSECNSSKPVFLRYGDKVCQACQPLCERCEYHTGRCLKCFQGSFMSKIGDFCVLGSQQGFFLDLVDGRMSQCGLKCTGCQQSANNCTTCYNS